MKAAGARDDMNIPDIDLTTRQMEKWGHVSATEQGLIVKVICRLLLLKGKCIFWV
jgi:hypothetical protein